jgi:hypothetical protein
MGSFSRILLFILLATRQCSLHFRLKFLNLHIIYIPDRNRTVNFFDFLIYTAIVLQNTITSSIPGTGTYRGYRM